MSAPALLVLDDTSPIPETAATLRKDTHDEPRLETEPIRLMGRQGK